MLYYRNGNPIFATASTASNVEGAGSVDVVADADLKTF